MTAGLFTRIPLRALFVATVPANREKHVHLVLPTADNARERKPKEKPAHLVRNASQIGAELREYAVHLEKIVAWPIPIAPRHTNAVIMIAIIPRLLLIAGTEHVIQEKLVRVVLPTVVRA